MILLLEKIRPLIFWTLDDLTGKNVRRHYEDIDYIQRNHPSHETQTLIDERLNKILRHAVNTTEYYRKYDQFTSLCDFPVVNKNIIKDHYEAFISNRYQREALNMTSTSGSTGIPFVILRDSNKKKRNTADVIYFEKLAGFKLGMRLYFIRGWNDATKKGRFTSWFQNVINVSVFDLSDNQVIQKLVKAIENDRSHIALLGYASAFNTICKYLDSIHADPVKANIKGIIAMSEALHDYTKSAMMKYFNAPVVSRYSNQDNGIIAQQSVQGEDDFYLNYASFLVEILDMENDVPAPFGVPGRIVVTDYFNYGMPFIRYDTGDIGIMKEKKTGQKTIPVLSNIEGRKSDMVFATDGRLVSPFAISFVFSDHYGIKQYQFVQKEKTKYTLILNCDKPYVREKEIISKLKDNFGMDSTIDIQYVNEIPLVASGKRKRVINEYIKDKN